MFEWLDSFSLRCMFYFIVLWIHSVPSRPCPGHLFPHHICSHHIDRCWNQSSAPTPVKAPQRWWTAGPSLAHWSRQFHLLLFFFLFRGGGRWSPLVKWIKIPNNSNNNDNKKLIKNGMFLPDCASVVVFNYAIFIGILIIFSTNKPPLIKAKHG